jgi:hypothetical protein
MRLAAVAVLALLWGGPLTLTITSRASGSWEAFDASPTLEQPGQEGG